MSNTAAAWLACARRDDIAGELDAIYAMIADQVAARGPTCWASGRCCNFERAGHRLYTTGLEAAYCVARLEPARGAWLTEAALTLARARGDCPFLEGHTCGVHAIKPSACRIYFCDEAAQGWQHELTERVHGMIRGLHERHGIEYWYGEWRELLALFVPRA
ncbi:MAG: hypothetical protein GC200_00335 [Tepidisphaera sp.]|nr:hypothetical protein [Tepidisphaera sp.]